MEGSDICKSGGTGYGAQEPGTLLFHECWTITLVDGFSDL